MPSKSCNEKIVIRKARREDCSKILDIGEEAWSKQGMSYRLKEKFGIVGSRTPGQRIRETLSGLLQKNLNNTLVAEVNGNVAGFLIYSFDDDRKIGHIGYNAVSYSFRGKGIGTRLVREALSVFKERGMRYAMVFTDLDEAHAAARRVYEKCGFKPLVKHVTYFMKL